MPSSMAIAAPALSSKREYRPPQAAAETAAAALSSSIFTERIAKGPEQSAQMAIRQKTPAEFLIMPAAERIAEAESERIPPTTGSAVLITVFAAFTAAASALPLMTPLNPIYIQKPAVKSVIEVTEHHLTNRHVALRIAFSQTQEQTEKARKAYISGKTMPCASSIYSVAAKLTEAYFTEADTAALLAATAE